MGIFKKSKKEKTNFKIQTAPTPLYKHPFSYISSYLPISTQQLKLYESLREAVPIIDAAICKTIRLIGDFHVKCQSEKAEKELNAFLKSVPVGASCKGINAFINSYFDSLLTYGTAVGEIVTDRRGNIFGLYNAYLDDIELRQNEGPMSVTVCTKTQGGAVPAYNQDMICISAINPKKGSVYGTSILSGLPFVSEILLKIYNTIGVNWERTGNVRYAVTYLPNPENPGNTAENVKLIASEWSKAMAKESGISDFIAAGDVNIKVIGADGTILDSEIPARQMLEQIIAKLSIPPFLLGLSWSTTERMSSQQADILTSELEYYRSILNPVINKICSFWLLQNGFSPEFEIDWNCINLQDEVELANARHTNAQAAILEAQLKNAESEMKEGENYDDKV